MSKKLAIFGCGYLGSEIARQAQDKGWIVVALTHNEDVASSLRSLGLSQVVVDDLDGDSWHDAIDANQDYVVNCVGSSSHDVPGYVKSYVEGQESIMKWSEKGVSGLSFILAALPYILRRADVWWMKLHPPMAYRN